MLLCALIPLFTLKKSLVFLWLSMLPCYTATLFGVYAYHPLALPCLESAANHEAVSVCLQIKEQVFCFYTGQTSF